MLCLRIKRRPRLPVTARLMSFELPVREGRALIPPIRPCACVMFQRGLLLPRAKAAASFKIEHHAPANFRRSFVVAPCRPRCDTRPRSRPLSAVAALRTNACTPTSRPRAAASPKTNNVTKVLRFIFVINCSSPGINPCDRDVTASRQVYFVASWRGLSTVRAPGRTLTVALCARICSPSAWMG